MTALSWLLLATLPVHGATLAQARAAERDGAWNQAAGHYETLAREGSGPAVRRLAWLHARQDADGDWDGLEALDQSRRGQGRDGALAVRDDPGASPLVQQEAALWLAGQALDQGHLDEALVWTDGVWRVRETLPRPVLGQLVRLRAEALAAAGLYDQARQVESTLEVQSAAPRPSRTDRIERAARHQAIAWGSGLVGGVVVVGLVPAAWRGWRRRPWPRPFGLIPLVLLLAGTAALVEQREPGSGAWAVPLTLLAVGVHLLSAGAGRGRGPWGRAVVGAAAAVATLAGAWVCLWRTDTLAAVGL